MATSEKPSTQSPLRDAARDAVRDTARDASGKIESIKEKADRFMSDTSPRVRDAVNQASDVASDLYGRANTWLNEGNNKNYSIIALVATVGVLGFFLGRNLRESSREY